MRSYRVVFLFLLHLLTADAINGVEYLDLSQGKIYLYFKNQAATQAKAVKVCKANNMKLLSVEQQAEQNWLKKIIGNIFHGGQTGTISAFVCEKNYVRRINNFTLHAVYPFNVNEIFKMTGNRLQCATHCSEIIHCCMFTYVSNACRFYSNYTGSGRKPACDRLQCYVKMHNLNQQGGG